MPLLAFSKLGTHTARTYARKKPDIEVGLCPPKKKQAGADLSQAQPGWSK